MEQLFKYKVCTRCFTYNHAPYIEETLHGFSMQETTFPVVYCIVDDASTDGEQDVINSYLKKNFDLEDKTIVRNEETDDYLLTFARHKTNPNCYFVVFFLKYNHYSMRKKKVPLVSEWLNNAKYIALCEGDDYWIDPLKLQKQVDLLEEHRDVGLCYAKCRYYYQDRQRFEKETWGGSYVVLKDMLKKNTVPTLSVLYRTDLYFRFTDEKKPETWLMGDYPFWLYCAAESKVHFLDQEVGVYRVLNESSSHTNSMDKKMNFSMSQIDIQEYYNKKYNVGYGHAHFDAVRDMLRLRTYAIYHKKIAFLRELLNMKRKGNLKWTHLKYCLFFVAPGISNKRQ